jgi:hypothetical protein
MRSSFRFIRSLLLIFLGFFFFITSTSIEVEALAIHIFDSRLKIQPSPLIGGPTWLPLHCKVIIDDTHIYDFVPLNATTAETFQKLIQLQAVPAKVQIIRRSSEPQTNNNNNNSYKNEEYDNNSKVNNDEEAKLFIERAEHFCQEYDQDLHLIKSNCWSFAFDLILYVLIALPYIPKKERGLRIDNN